MEPLTLLGIILTLAGGFVQNVQKDKNLDKKIERILSQKLITQNYQSNQSNKKEEEEEH